MWRGRSPDSLHVRQRDKLQPEIPSLRLELQCGLRLLPRLVSHKINMCRENYFHFVHSRYYLNDLTYRTDPPKSSTESYNVRRRKSWWSVKEPEVEDEEVEAKEEKVEEAEFNIADLGYWKIYSWETLCLKQLRAYSSSNSDLWSNSTVNIYLFIYLCIRIIRLVLTTAKCGYFVNSLCYQCEIVPFLLFLLNFPNLFLNLV